MHNIEFDKKLPNDDSQNNKWIELYNIIKHKENLKRENEESQKRKNEVEFDKLKDKIFMEFY